MLLQNPCNNQFCSGTCIPFSKKVFVTATGDILMCEKISHKFIVGHIGSENVIVDYEKAAKVFNETISNRFNQCKGCHLQEICSECIFTLDNFKCTEYTNHEAYLARLRQHVYYYERTGQGKEYIIYLHQYVYINISLHCVLLYNELNFKYKNANFVIYPEFVIGDYNLNKNIIKSQEKSDTIIYLAKHNAYDLDNIFKRPVRFCLKKSKLSFAIGPNGYVYNCETVVGNVRASLGNIQKDTFRFPDKNFILPQQCESCRLLPICTLGCDSNLNGSKCNIMKSREENFLLMFYNQNKSSAE